MGRVKTRKLELSKNSFVSESTQLFGEWHSWLYQIVQGLGRQWVIIKTSMVDPISTTNGDDLDVATGHLFWAQLKLSDDSYNLFPS